MPKTTRVQWQEKRPVHGDQEVFFFIVAEKEKGEWRFFEKESAEVRWSTPQSTPERIQRAEQELAKQ